ncbi:MAG: D-alanine--D-alanine ligase [Arenicellales bacterium]|nr:D-alanine--D-alanine ligase [Arenicellales bacterium]
MASKIRVGILFGGKSAEHEVSLQSAKNVIEAIDREKYEVVLIGLDKQGRWLLNDTSEFLLNTNNPKLIKLNAASDSVALIPQSNGKISNLSSNRVDLSVDVVFPILHGPFGEDGTVQGLLKLANVPFVGAGVLGSAIGMDKDVMKRLLKEAGIPIGGFLVFRAGDGSPDYGEITNKLGSPLFVKPANLGSSVGISKVKSSEEFELAVREAFDYDTKILIEEYIDGREIECSVLGNDNPIASVPGEVLPRHEFYSYEAKYIDENGAALEVPAKLSTDIEKKVQDLAIKTFQTLSCEGLGRVDFFLKEDGEVLVNEINTIPGFTSISMYPRLWEASGISYGDLIEKLLQLAMERFEREQKLKTTYE